jgi:hypothetical protein
MSLLSINLAAPAHASCSTNLSDCNEWVTLVCRGKTFTAGSDFGNAEDLARIKARRAGYDPDYDCQARRK